MSAASVVGGERGVGGGPGWGRGDGAGDGDLCSRPRGDRRLDAEERPAPGKVRRPRGRKPISEGDPGLADDLERLVDPESRGDPESLLRWTSKSVRNLAEGLRELGHQVHCTTVLSFWGARGTACRRT